MQVMFVYTFGSQDEHIWPSCCHQLCPLSLAVLGKNAWEALFRCLSNDDPYYFQCLKLIEDLGLGMEVFLDVGCFGSMFSSGCLFLTNGPRLTFTAILSVLCWFRTRQGRFHSLGGAMSSSWAKCVTCDIWLCENWGCPGGLETSNPSHHMNTFDPLN